MTKSPYLETDRLAEVVAAIQAMANDERSSRSCREWAELVMGDPAGSDRLRRMFDQHREFFRRSPDDEDHYALIWRRASPRRFYRPERRMLSEAEYDQLPTDRKEWCSRPPVPVDQVETLIDIAVTMHAKALEQNREWRWWITPALGFCGAILGAALGAIFRTH